MNDDRQGGRKEIGGGGEWTALRELAAKWRNHPHDRKDWDGADEIYDDCANDLEAVLAALGSGQELLDKVKAIVMLRRDGDKADYHAIIHDLDALSTLSPNGGASSLVDAHNERVEKEVGDGLREALLRLQKKIDTLPFMDSQGNGPLVYRAEVSKLVRAAVRRAAERGRE